jgi:hypothetical protein
MTKALLSPRTVLSFGALTLAAVIFAFPAGATFRGCNSNCSIGDYWCFWQCRCAYKSDCTTTTKKAMSVRPPRPIAGTGVSTNPTGPTHSSTHEH